MTVNQSELAGWVGHTLLDERGDKIGKIVDIYADESTGQPEWIAVNTGWFGSNISFVPLAAAHPSGDNLQVGYPSDMVKDAPNATPDGHLSQVEEADLYRHYGMHYSEDWSPSGLPDAGGASGRTTDDAMTRSEEQLQVGKVRREAGRVRLRKYVVTEEQTRTVPVTREEVRVEREPITDANIDDTVAGPDISEAEHEVILHEEEPVVTKRTVPKERVRLDTDAVTEEREVTEEVRKERIEAEGDDGRRA